MKKTIVKNYIYRNRTFVIVYNDELVEGHPYYLAIEDKYIDESGRLNKGLNLVEMNAGDTFKDCEERLRNRCDLDYYMSQGADKYEAMAMVFNLDLNALREAFR